MCRCAEYLKKKLLDKLQSEFLLKFIADDVQSKQILEELIKNIS